MTKSGDFRNLDILVVDDQSFFRLGIGNMLSTLGCRHVRLVHGGIEALREVCHQHPDIIFLNVIMPGMDGLTASTVIRDYEADVGCRAFVIGLSNGKIDWQDYCLEAGMDGCLRAPVCRSRLETLLRDVDVTRTS